MYSIRRSCSVSSEWAVEAMTWKNVHKGLLFQFLTINFTILSWKWVYRIESAFPWLCKHIFIIYTPWLTEYYQQLHVLSLNFRHTLTPVRKPSPLQTLVLGLFQSRYNVISPTVQAQKNNEICQVNNSIKMSGADRVALNKSRKLKVGGYNSVCTVC